MECALIIVKRNENFPDNRLAIVLPMFYNQRRKLGRINMLDLVFANTYNQRRKLGRKLEFP